MFQSMSNWFGGASGFKKDQEELTPPEEETDSSVNPTKTTDSENNSEEVKKETETANDSAATEGESEGDDLGLPNLDEVSAKALNTAKVWGSFLLNVGKEATKTVTKTAQQLKEKTPLISDFQKEQDRFKSEMKKKHSEAAVPPWVGYNEEETMKEQIIALSQDRRNFLRNPPAGVQFTFEFDAMFPVAMATLQEDQRLEKMRFELVPKSIAEENFWRNYFYRVSLIKQSTQLTSMAQQRVGTDSSSTSSSDYDKLSDLQENRAEPAASESPEAEKRLAKPEDIPTGSSPPDHEFISDTFQTDDINEEEIRQEMLLLGMQSGEQQDEKSSAGVAQWEEELQQELREYEMVDDGADDDIEKEILEQLEQESQQT
ncbi:synapse-associated protein 1-like [Tubulanus polymorphus]|uniref:synapse-associated protein 1-like n=1 Tax=Tubulanus polymorphus TaxID=672921 RepID=UPI003DA55F20